MTDTRSSGAGKNSDTLLFTLSLIHKTVNRHLEQRVKAELDPALSISHADILMYLHLNGRATASELRHFLGLTKSTVTALINKLEDLGYIRRERDPRDGRVSWLRPAGQLRSKLGRARAIGAELKSALLTEFNAGEVKQLAALLQKLQGNLDRLSAGQ